MFILVYECPNCNEVWDQEYEHVVDDTCPKCGHRNVHPIEVIDPETKEVKYI